MTEDEQELQPRIDALARQLINSAGNELFDIALEAAIDLLCWMIVEGWLSPGENVIQKAITPDYDFDDRAAMAARIGSELPDRVEKWWAKHGRSGRANGEIDPLGMRWAIENGYVDEDDLDDEERRLIEKAGEGSAQARLAAVQYFRHMRNKARSNKDE
jgi:hypothetical protein